MLRTLVREVGRGKSLSRTLVNLRCAEVELKGNGIDLGSKDASASHYRFIQRGDASITYTDLNPKREGVVPLDLAATFPWESDSQDFLLCFHVLEHLPDPTNCLSEAARVLKPGGVFIGAVPFLHRIHPDPDDFNRSSGSALRRLASNAGFRESKVDAIGIGPFTAALHMVFGFIKLAPLRAVATVAALSLDRLLRLYTRKSWTDVYPVAYVFELTK